jgi:hypothetical protein
MLVSRVTRNKYPKCAATTNNLENTKLLLGRHYNSIKIVFIERLLRLQEPSIESVEFNLELYVLLRKTHFNIITHLRRYLSSDFSTYFFKDRRSPKLYIEEYLLFSRTKIYFLF